MTQRMVSIDSPRFSTSSKSGNMMRVVSLLAASAAGTGGSLNSHNIAQLLELQARPIIEIRGQTEKPLKVRTISQHLESIRDSFGLRMSEVAEIFGVSRPTAYAWLAGTEPRQEVSDRIWRLSKFADETRDLHLGQINRYMRYPVQDGLSVVDLLKSGQDVRKALIAVREISTQERGRRELLAQKRSGSRRRIVGLDEI